MVETGRFGCAVAISMTQFNLSAILRRSGAAVDLTGIDAAVVPVYKNRNNNVIGVNGSSFVALPSAFCGLFTGCCCCCGTAGGGCCSFVMFFSRIFLVNNDMNPKNHAVTNSIPRKKMQTKQEKNGGRQQNV